MQPSVGRIVHYVSYGTPGGEYTSKCRAATITEVGAWVDITHSAESISPTMKVRVRNVEQMFDDEACALTVQNPTGLFFNVCRHDEDQTPGTWHWPERV